MQQSDPKYGVSRRAVIISPDSSVVAELQPLIAKQLTSLSLTHLNHYPSPRDAGATLSGGGSHVVFLDVASDPDQALQLLAEMTRVGANVQVLALLAGDDPDVKIGRAHV